jgi:hypothetical protein
MPTVLTVAGRALALLIAACALGGCAGANRLPSATYERALFDHVIGKEIVAPVAQEDEFHGLADAVEVEPLLKISDRRDPVVAELHEDVVHPPAEAGGGTVGPDVFDGDAALVAL